MTNEQIVEICKLMEQAITKELGLRCGHRSQGPRVYKRPGYQTPGVPDFFVDLEFWTGKLAEEQERHAK